MAKKSKKNNLATKADITKLAKSINELRSESKNTKKSLWREILNVEERLEQKIDKNRDDIMTKLDGIAGGVDALREENTVGADQTRELRVQVDDHEARLTTLESQ